MATATTTRESLLPPGTRVADRYEVGAELGRGGYSIVYEAQDHSLGSAVALKLLVPPPAAAKVAEQRLRREVLAVRSLDHPHIVRIFELVEHGPWLLVVMELVRGGDLQQHVERHGPLDSERVAALGRPLAEALGAAHRRGIVHRDIKPRNILLTAEGLPKLADFGAARIDGLDGLTQTGGLVGTLEYAAPELTAGRRGDGRSDVYSLGRTLYFAAHGALPTDPSFVRGGRDPLAPWLGEIIDRACSPEPERRYTTADELAAALAERGRGAVLRESSVRAVGEARDAAASRAAGAARGETTSLAFGAGRLPAMGAEPSSATRCVACGEPKSVGAGRGPAVCASCELLGRAASSSTRLVVLDGARNGEGSSALATMFRMSPARYELAEALGGRRALVRTSEPLAARLIEQLASRGLTAQSIHPASSWRLLPRGFAWLLCGILTVGVLSSAAVPALLLATPLVMGLLLWLATRQLATGVVSLASDGPVYALPEPVAARLVRAAAELPAGPARTLLSELIERVEQAYGAGASGVPELGALVDGCCAAAAELAQLERALDGLARLPIGHGGRAAGGSAEPGSERGIERDDGANTERARCEQLRDRLTQRLLEAISALSSVALRRIAGPDSAESQLAALTYEIQQELALRTAVDAELHELLAAR